MKKDRSFTVVVLEERSIIDNEQRLCIANCYYQSKTSGAADYTLTGIYTIVRKSQNAPLHLEASKSVSLGSLVQIGIKFISTDNSTFTL